MRLAQRRQVVGGKQAAVATQRQLALILCMLCLANLISSKQPSGRIFLLHSTLVSAFVSLGEALHRKGDRDREVLGAVQTQASNSEYLADGC